jgi:hypothetical protein
MKTKPWMMLVAMMAGWLNRQQVLLFWRKESENEVGKLEV